MSWQTISSRCADIINACSLGYHSGFDAGSTSAVFASHMRLVMLSLKGSCVLLTIHEQRLDLLLLPELDCNMSKLVFAFRRVPS